MIDQKFKEVTTINTPIDLLQWTCLPYGIKTSAIFQKALENILLGKIENMIIYHDSTCMGASSKELLKQKKLKRVLKELKKDQVKSKSG